MLISTRQAADLLLGRVATFEQTRHLLRCGAAGPGVRIGRSVAYDGGRVGDLGDRPWVDERRLARECPWGVHVARVARSRIVDVDTDWEAQARQLSEQPAMPSLTAALLGVRIGLSGGLPWIATVSGLVVLGAEVAGWRTGGQETFVFDLRPPGSWFDGVHGRWFRFQEGRPWFFWDPTRLPQ
jgi:hypothetical protein